MSNNTLHTLALMTVMGAASCGPGNVGAPFEAHVGAPVAERVAGDAVDILTVEETVREFETRVGALTLPHTISFTVAPINAPDVKLAQGYWLAGLTRWLGRHGALMAQVQVRLLTQKQKPTVDARETALFHELMHVYLRQTTGGSSADHKGPMWAIVDAFEAEFAK